MGGGDGGWVVVPSDYSLNPTTVSVVLLLGFWLLLGCDNTRELYSLVESIDKVKLPSFEGRDFSKQKELTERAFVKCCCIRQ